MIALVALPPQLDRVRFQMMDMANEHITLSKVISACTNAAAAIIDNSPQVYYNSSAWRQPKYCHNPLCKGNNNHVWADCGKKGGPKYQKKKNNNHKNRGKNNNQKNKKKNNNPQKPGGKHQKGK